MITKGNRTQSLYNRASDLNKDGATYEQIERTIRYMNREMITPPLSEGRIRCLLKTVSKWCAREANHVD